VTYNQPLLMVRRALSLTGLMAAAIITDAGMCTKPLPGAQYYFSQSGNDVTGDGTQSSPWRSISKFNSLDLNPGDSAFFRSGDIFPGSLVLDSNDTGIDATGNLIAPITISSYGGGPLDRAIIHSDPNAAGLLAVDNGGIDLKNLEFLNGGSYQTNSASGIQFSTDYSATTGLNHLSHIHIDNVASHGFHQSGLAIDATNDVGYQDVQVSNSQFYDNQFAGLEIGANKYTNLVHRDVQIDNVVAHDNQGLAGCTPHCGHGIILGQVDGAVIQNSAAYSNGLVAGKGNVGIWTWQSNNVVIQGNTAYGNRSPSGADGGGFDIDGGVTNSIVQYNTSFDNAGAGFLLAEFAYAGPMTQNVIRYNLSVNDGADNYGAFTISGSDSIDTASSAVIHNNTAVVDHNIAPSSRGTVWFANVYYSDLDFINNVLVALNGSALIDGTTSSDKSKFLSNDYWTDGAPAQIGGTTYPSISAWSATTQQEMLNGQFEGLQADPNFSTDGTYRPMSISQLIDAGLPPDSPAWPAWLTGIGQTDLYGIDLPQGNGLDIGAAEYSVLLGDYNHDGRVDGSDYILWRKLSGQSGAGLLADGNGDGVVDIDDYSLWRVQFGKSVIGGTGFAERVSALQSIPEPSTFLLFLVACSLTGLMKKQAMVVNRSIRL
jgi:hypothetical protein